MNAFKGKKVMYEQVSSGIFGESRTAIKGTLKQISENT
jgi:hypothetical protein